MILWLIGGLILLLALIAVYYANTIIVLSNRINNASSQISVQLKKRADLVPNLVETVKGYAKHERNMIANVTKARERMLGAGNLKEKIKANGELTKALKTIFALAENYPNLKANENFKLLQEQLEGIENKIAYARQFYNDSVLRFNNMITTIPGIWFAKIVGKDKKHEYFEITEEEKRPVNVKF